MLRVRSKSELPVLRLDFLRVRRRQDVEYVVVSLILFRMVWIRVCQSLALLSSASSLLRLFELTNKYLCFAVSIFSCVLLPETDRLR